MCLTRYRRAGSEIIRARARRWICVLSSSEEEPRIRFVYIVVLISYCPLSQERIHNLSPPTNPYESSHINSWVQIHHQVMMCPARVFGRLDINLAYLHKSNDHIYTYIFVSCVLPLCLWWRIKSTDRRADRGKRAICHYKPPPSY